MAAGAAWHWWPEDVRAEPNLAPRQEAVAEVDGRELFHRSWLADDPRSPQGDGLGPMFNETSCAGCHNQGGPGGGGSTDKNVDLLTAFIGQPQVRFSGLTGVNPPGVFNGGSTIPGGVTGFSGGGFGQQQAFANTPEQRQAILAELKQIHPDFEKSSSVVIHRFGKSSQHNAWRTSLLNAQQQVTEPVPINATSMNFDGSTGLVQVSFDPPQQAPAATLTEPVASEVPLQDSIPVDAGPAPAQPPTTEGATPISGPTAPTQPVDSPATFQPVAQPVPSSLASGFLSPPSQPVAQLASVQVVPASTGIPLVDEALAEMRRLQQEARQDLSSQTNRGRVILHRSQRNTSALFGSGVLDAIPDSVIEAAAAQKHEDFPRVSGRVHRLSDNKIGKFGWKAQKSTLREFTLAACANELGLDVPGHAQPVVPYEAHEKPKGHDMTDKEADALVAFVKNLPAPIEETPSDENAAKVIEEGKKLFESVGCAVCHKQDMGDAKGVYSDLLLHDMGEHLQASGSYGSSFTPQEFDPNANPAPAAPSTGPGPAQGEGSALTPTDNSDPLQPGEAGNQPAQPQAAAQPSQVQPAASGEWRTPPLWGLRDSAPYLHDGRAATIEQAIAIHGGEGSDAAIRFFMLPAKKQQQAIAFLKTLRAPEQHAAK
jgi:CxxC motif-containing protein (DUF1111 family)